MSKCPRRKGPASLAAAAQADTPSSSTMTAPEFPQVHVNSNTLNTPATATTYTPALLTAVPSRSHVHLVIGSNALASARCTRSLEVGAIVKLISPSSDPMHYGVRKRIDDGEVQWMDREFRMDDLTSLGREAVDNVVDAVFVTLDANGNDAAAISAKCRRLRIPVNVADSSSLSTFTLLSTYADGPLQIGITTSGMGCKLASRLRRTIAQSFPAGIGLACERLGRLRRQIWEEDCKTLHNNASAALLDVEEDDAGEQKNTFNTLIQPHDAETAKSRRIRWLSQICEYWPLQKLCDLTDADVDTLFNEYAATNGSVVDAVAFNNDIRGTISLVGSGPGNPDLLTKASLDAINTADLVLADKLVPEPVLALIPRRTDIFIARKFPGNADAAQQELLEKGLDAINQGKNVVRLKQGDPYIYGRGAEEFEFFEKHGVKVDVIPGITSALSAPLYAGIPATHRAVADQVLICTGTGRKGVAPDPPAYVKSQTTVFLMACHRLPGLVDGLKGKGWPMEVPCAVIERASCKDQRVIRSTLGNICAAVEELGSRPPGLFVTGWACEVLKKGGEMWTVEEGV
ncbi:hypothetical protein H072_9635 [Dactylellina haptotyla CBS 200.50]|uniref:Precorrin-2 dehydrogenase n=1 Tax=Dactylellina haptotyla (strain CBS 200.50) TaxID=1284197 RepID=S8BNJ7_DACHA|nr:hypothetical protein H072_9635 [Dactylellina haptotyla CBS 200.50]